MNTSGEPYIQSPPIVPPDVMRNVTGYINAGGRGTRLNTVFNPHPKFGISKALLKVGIPAISLIEHQINKLNYAGVTGIVVGAGNHVHVAEYVEAIYGDAKNVYALVFDDQLGNGGDLLRAVRNYPHLFDEHILVVNVDGLMDLDEKAVVLLHRSRKASVTIALTQRKGVPNEGSYFVGYNDRVIYTAETTTNIINKRKARKIASYYGSSTGVLVIRHDFLGSIEWLPSDGPLSLYRDIVASALKQGGMFSYNNGDRFFVDIGTPDTWNYASCNPGAFQPYLHYC